MPEPYQQIILIYEISIIKINDILYFSQVLTFGQNTISRKAFN